MQSCTTFTRHGRNRCAERAIPHGIADLIVEHGVCAPARDGALRHSLDKRALRCIRQHYGPEVAKAVDRYRTVDLITHGARIVTGMHKTAATAKAARRATAR
jgi:hypothetical protein